MPFLRKENERKTEATSGVKLKCDYKQTFPSSALSTDIISLESFWVFAYSLPLVKFGLTHGMLGKCPAISRSHFTFHLVVIKVICEHGR